MKLLKHLIFIFVAAFSIICAEDLPKYRMVDLGLFGTDYSYAIAINEKGQVLGKCVEGASDSTFLWDEVNGLKIIDLPKSSNYWELKLNKNGQIAGVSYSDFIYRVFYWDSNLGLWELESSKNQINIVAFNDMGQVLGNIGDQMFLWDHGKKTNLTVLFLEQIRGDWASFQAVSLNNHGHVAFNAYKLNTTQYDAGFRSFSWKDGLFKMLITESEWNAFVNVICVENSVNVVCMDDDGNMILTLFSKLNGGYGHLQYFINPSRNIFASCQGCHLIRNGLPIASDCTHGKLKMDNQGNLYFSRGTPIKKLIKEMYPYYNVSNTLEVRDQNSRGYVVGIIDTMFPGNHAFLAIPEGQN